MTASSEATGSVDTSAVESLRRVRAAETSWEARLAEARERTDALLREVAAETETAVAGARRAAESERDRAIQAAREQADREAADILSRARAEAERIRTAPAADLGARADRILGAILSEFRSGKKGRE